MARAERPRGTCPVCTKDCAITEEGGVRHHFTEDPALQAGPDSRKCRGVGQPPAGAEPEPDALRFLCRVPSGPDGCGHQVQLTANHRARSHLTPQGEPCAEGGSAFPVAVGPDGYRADTTQWTEADWERVFPKPVIGLADVFKDDARNATVTPGGVSDQDSLPHDRQLGEAGVDQRMTRAGAETLDRYTPPAGPGQFEQDMHQPLSPENRAALFDVTHTYDDGAGGTWVHPGEAGDCRLPDCCTHPEGFTYGDDGYGHSGSFCDVCGEPEPEWGTPPDLLAQMPEEMIALYATEPPCWDCGDRLMLAVEAFEPDGSPRSTVWTCDRNCEHVQGSGHYGRPCRPQAPWQDRLGHLDEGDFFRRHITRGDGLVYRVEAVTDFAVQATVLNGAHAGRTGELTNLSEEITCTDKNGTPRPRRALGTASTSPSSPDQPDPIPSPSEVTAPAPSRVPSSTPTTSPIAKQRSASSTARSTKVTSSGPSETVSTPTPSAPKGSAVPDAFTTAKAAVKESDKYDNYGRYKLLHPKTGKPVKWTRATTFCKSVQDPYALNQWAKRMVLKGAALRPDIVAAVSTLDVKADKDRVNALVADAEKAAGNKVAANLGTAVHAFTEDRDRVLVGLPVEPKPVPAGLLPSVDAYEVLLRDFGLEPVPGLIEFTTAVLQYEIAGTSDRVYRATRDITFKLKGRTVSLYAGEYVIGDVKTGADLSYGWLEICIQLAIYAQGLNANGIWGWGTLTWGVPEKDGIQIKVRTDVGLIPHLPVDRKPGAPLATLYAVDLDFGWATAVLCAQVRSTRKEGGLATALSVADVDETAADVVRRAPMASDHDGEEPAFQPSAIHAVRAVTARPATLEEKARAVTTQAAASALWQELTAARTPKAEVDRLVRIMQEKLASHVEQGA